MSAHTPGPWKVDVFNLVYALNANGINRFGTRVVKGCTSEGKLITNEELEANARLIAAAPELLAVLMDMRLRAADEEDSMREAGIWTPEDDAIAAELHARAADVIQKATGQKEIK